MDGSLPKQKMWLTKEVIIFEKITADKNKQNMKVKAKVITQAAL